MDLNKEQKEAVTHKEGPLLIVAGAGTGKTTVITHRIAYLIKEGFAEPEEILALTFTDKAASEMDSRVDSMLSRGYLDMWISTFHSFSRRVLKRNGLDIGLPNNFNLLDQTNTWLLVRKNLDRFDLDHYKPLGKPTKFISALISHFSKCKNQAVTPQEYLWFAQESSDDRLLELARAYGTYQELLLEGGSLDFGDLINYTIKLFEERESILEKYRGMFKYILVDEFQDNNWAQYQLTKLISGPDYNLTVVADDDQSVYAFRGASYGNISQLTKDVPDVKKISLVQNYRSRQGILDKAYEFIQQNNPDRLEVQEDVDKNLKAQKEGGQVEHLHLKTLEAEVQAVVNKIISLGEDVGFSDIAILVRSNRTAEPFCRGLERSRVPYTFLALRGLYSKPVVLDTISYFKLLLDPYDTSSFYRVLRLPFLGIPESEVAKIIRWSRKKAEPVYKTLQDISSVGVSKQTENTVVDLLEMLDKHTKASRKNVSELFIDFLTDSDYLDYLAKEKDKGAIENVNQFYDKIKAFEGAHIEASLPHFMDELQMELDSGEEGRLNLGMNGSEAVRVMTIHKSKGLEFRYVFLVNLVNRRFPSTNRSDPIPLSDELVKDILPEGDAHLQEERRLFYVGMTRAKEGVFLTSALDYGGVRKKKPSRFLSELGYKDPEVVSVETGVQKREKKVKEQKIKRDKGHFSFTQFRAFESCPLQYKFAHILRVPLQGKAVFSYGSSLHNTLERFIREGGDIFEIYEEEWIEDWFHSEEERKEYREKGVQSLEKFQEGYDDTVMDIRGEPAVEVPFRLKVGGETIVGKIDRIDQLEDGVELIDYKTGKTRKRLRRRDKAQLLIYQMAAQESLGLNPQKLTYYYLDEGKKLSFLGSPEEIAEEKDKLQKLIKNIEDSNFEPTPGWQCKFCDFKKICEHA